MIEEIIVKNSIKRVNWQAWLASITCFTALILISQEVAAGGTSFGSMAKSMTDTFGDIGSMITGGFLCWRISVLYWCDYEV